MCGRFSLTAPGQLWFEIFGLSDPPAWAPRYNIAPTQPVAAVLVPPDQGQREFRLLQWGLIPSWAKAPTVGAEMINARAETAPTKPAFRAAFRRRRCLVLADGFYEWARQGGRRQPFYVRLRDGRPFAFAGLWEHWEGPEGQVIEGSEGPEAMITSLTWAGHEFAEAARDDTRWQKAMGLVRDKGGSVTLGVLTQLLTSLMKGAFGIP